MKIIALECCECGCKQTFYENEGMRCELCSLENFVEFLESLGWRTPDYCYGYGGFTHEDRAGHNKNLNEKRKKLKELREKYPERAEAYKLKNPEGSTGEGHHYVTL